MQKRVLSMINPVQTSIPQQDGGDRFVIIEPVLEREGYRGLGSTGVFKIYKDAFGDETHLFTELAASGEKEDSVEDDQNPDYLGKFIFEHGQLHQFDGHLLSIAEQAFLAVFIETYQEPDI